MSLDTITRPALSIEEVTQFLYAEARALEPLQPLLRHLAIAGHGRQIYRPSDPKRGYSQVPAPTYSCFCSRRIAHAASPGK